MNGTLLYFLYGSSPAYQLELTYSVLSAVKNGANPADFRIVLLTDERNQRPDLPIENVLFTQSDFDRWSLGGRFGHAAKVSALSFALERFGGKVAMVDTDTYFLKSPAELFGRISAEQAVMHADEGTLADQNGYWDKIIDGLEPGVVKAVKVSHQSRMWNSGVVGIDRSILPEFPKIIGLMERIYSIDPGVHNLEQFSTGAVLGSRLGIVGCDDVVRHYWGYGRPFVHSRLARMFPSQTRKVFERQLDRSDPVEGFPARRTTDLIRSKLKRFWRRETEIYGFAYLAYLSAFHSRDMADANAWATVAIDALRFNKIDPRLAARDFKRLMRPRGNLPDWLEPDTRDHWLRYQSAG